MINDALNSSFFHAKVAVGLFSHSLELFLKGGIIQAGGEVFNTHIDLVVWLQQLLLFSSDYERLEPLFKQRYSINTEKKDT